jgi:hypothetical protein
MQGAPTLSRLKAGHWSVLAASVVKESNPGILHEQWCRGFLSQNPCEPLLSARVLGKGNAGANAQRTRVSRVGGLCAAFCATPNRFTCVLCVSSACGIDEKDLNS